MKKTILIITLATLSSASFSYASCYDDGWGNFNCRYSDGSNSSTYSDGWGNDITNFSNGSSVSCYNDGWGNYICN